MDVFAVIQILQQLLTRLRQPALGTDIPWEEEKWFRAAQRILDNSTMYRALTAQEGQALAYVALDLFDAGLVQSLSQNVEHSV